MLNPWIIIGVMVAVGTSYGYGHHKGWVDRDAEMQAEIAKLNEKSRETEQALNQTLNDKDQALRKAKNEISKKLADVDKLIDADQLRLPVQATTSCVSTTPDTASASGNRDEARPDTYREAIKAIVALAIEGDRNTLQLNSCIDTYNEVREKINGKR
jgi:enoyl reductase-like protein